MSFVVNERTRVICEGITGRQGTFNTAQAIAQDNGMVGKMTESRGAVAEKMQAQRG
jgi:succinyl-CoA synthetase alpha subunit